VGQPEAAADDATVAKQAPDLVGVALVATSKSLGFAPEQQVADAAADQVGGVVEAAQALDHLCGLGIYLFRRNLHNSDVRPVPR
jgi:hypothetical protein